MIKYSKKCHINSLLKRGSIRIGTLHEYRNCEYTEGIHDNSEGLKRVNLTLNGTLDFSLGDSRTQNIKNNFFGGVFNNISNGTVFEGDGCSFSREVSYPNSFIFCTSSQRVDLVPKVFGYDAGVKIINPEKFIDVISKEMKAKYGAKLSYFDEIKYKSKEEEWNGINFGENPAIYKDESFSYQSEIRAIWTMPNHSLGLVAPTILQIPELKKYVHPIQLG